MTVQKFSASCERDKIIDAMRLAAEANMCILISETGSKVVSYNSDGTLNLAIVPIERHNNDKVSATCEAISIAASKIKIQQFNVIKND